MTEQNREISTVLTKVNDSFFPMIEKQLQGKGISMDGYAKQCVISALAAMHHALEAKGITWNDPQLDRSSVAEVLIKVACLKLNAAASPREVFFQTRNVKVKDSDGKDVWKKQIEMGIEGDGNDAILARFGRDVKKVGQFWLVREHDHFEYPTYNGLEFTPPKWTPTGKGKVVRVVYPILKTDGSIEFYIAEREDVARNLLAHINNNLMNETFGIAKNRFEATEKQKKEIAAKKAEVLKRAEELGLDALDDPELQKWISPAWIDYHSREQMIIRKMRNNIVKKIPKDFGNAYVEITYHESTDGAEAAARGEIAANANGEIIDVEPEPAPEPEDIHPDSQTQAGPEPPSEPETASVSDPEPKVKKSGQPQQQTLDPTGTDGPDKPPF